MTNLPREITEEGLAAWFNFASVVLINVLTAVCSAISILDKNDLMQIKAGEVYSDQPIAVIVPSTGLGKGFVFGGRIVSRIAEHVSFSGFLQAFNNKGKMTGLMETIPVHLILKQDCAPAGVMRYGRQAI